MDDRTRTLLTAPPAPLLVRLATPNAIAFLLQSIVSLAEVWFIGRLGTQALASIALVFPALMLVNGMAGAPSAAPLHQRSRALSVRVIAHGPTRSSGTCWCWPPSARRCSS